MSETPTEPAEGEPFVHLVIRMGPEFSLLLENVPRAFAGPLIDCAREADDADGGVALGLMCIQTVRLLDRTPLSVFTKDFYAHLLHALVLIDPAEPVPAWDKTAEDISPTIRISEDLEPGCPVAALATWVTVYGRAHTGSHIDGLCAAVMSWNAFMTGVALSPAYLDPPDGGWNQNNAPHPVGAGYITDH